jgi:hypothetical protein
MGSSVITSQTGGEIGWPNSDGRTEIGEQLEQNAPSSSQNPTFGQLCATTNIR